MTNKVLDKISKYAIAVLQKHYNYCGCAEADDFCMLNSSSGDKDFKITIKETEE